MHSQSHTRDVCREEASQLMRAKSEQAPSPPPPPPLIISSVKRKSIRKTIRSITKADIQGKVQILYHVLVFN
jgi:hypothetical protein